MPTINKTLSSFICFLLITLVSSIVAAQNTITSSDSLSLRADIVLTDSIPTDSIPADTTQHQSGAIDAPVNYQSADSMIMIIDETNYLYLFGQGNVKYKDLDLSAEYVEVNTDSSQVFAQYALDSIGNEFGYPIFKQGESEYESKTMKYNFKTKKGFITEVVTQQGEGYLTAGRTKKMDNNDMYMVGGRYTTCDDHEHPHFYLNLTKVKVIPKKSIVSGPAYLVVADVPLPIALPFGFFPFTSDYSSGIIMPTYGDEMVKGFSLRGGGYYFAFNDYIDMALTGEIYTKGSWGLNARSSYRKRYKFSGSIDAAYILTKTEDYKSKDFKVNWSHTQDPKANPYTRVSASVNFTTNSYDQNTATYGVSALNPNYTTNTKASTVNISKTFPNNSLSLNASMSINQQTRDSITSITFPNLTIGYGQTYPFKRKNSVGDPKWYEQIYFSYSGSLRNSISTKDSLVFKSSLIKDWEMNMTHSIPISASFNLFNYINITPSINFQSDWYTKKIEREYNNMGIAVPSDTLYGFHMVNRYSASVSLNTKLYGFYQPWKIFGGEKIQAIRHVLTPRVSFTGAPGFDRYYNRISYYDGQDGSEISDYYYTPYPSAPGREKTGSVSLGFDNNIEMKIRSDSDSTGYKKISLIDNLGFSTSYNFLAKERKWSDISANLRLKITKSYTFNLGAVFDAYAYDENAKITKPRWEVGKGFGRLRSTGSSFSYSFNNDWLKKLLSKEEDAEEGNENQSNEPVSDENGPTGEEDTEESRTSLRGAKKDTGEYDENGYLITNMPWNISFNLGVSVGYGTFNKEKREYDYRMSKNLGLQGSLTPAKGWNFSFSTSYDFDASKFTTMNCVVTRDLHCWQMSANIIPVGPYQSYSFTIAVKSSLLQDLKYTQSSNYRDAVNWE